MEKPAAAATPVRMRTTVTWLGVTRVPINGLVTATRATL